MLQKIKKIVNSSVLIVLVVLCVGSITGTASATTTEVAVTCDDGFVATTTVESGTQPDTAALCSGHQTSSTNSRGTCTESNLNESNCGIIYYINMFINILSAMVGIVVTGVIIWGGIIYSTSKGDPGKVAEGKKKIMNGIMSLAMFIFAYAFLQWVVPGGIFH